MHTCAHTQQKEQLMQTLFFLGLLKGGGNHMELKATQMKYKPSSCFGEHLIFTQMSFCVCINIYLGFKKDKKKDTMNSTKDAVRWTSSTTLPVVASSTG